MKSEAGIAKIRAYYERYIAMAKENGLGFVLEAHTWRANPDWAAKLGYSRAQLADANRARDRADGGHAPPARDAAHADCHFGKHRPARRRL